MATNESLKEAPSAPQAQDKAKRERSTILFPYLDLDDAVGVAKGVHVIEATASHSSDLPV